MLNSQSPIPLYHQLSDILLSRIRSGQYPRGSRIPSEHHLADAFGIGRPTVRQAIEVLVRKRLLVRRRGSGTFVAEGETQLDLFSLAGTLSAFENKGLAVTRRLLEKPAVVRVTQDRENPFSGQRACFFSRLSQVEDTPVLIEKLFLHPELFPGIEQIDLAGHSLSQIVSERYYMRPTGGRQTFRIEYPTEDKASVLAVSRATPILVVNRYLDFPQANQAIFAILYCRTDRFVFSQTIGGPTHD